MPRMLLLKQYAEPVFIQQRPLVGGFPDGTNLFCLVSSKKDLPLHGQCNHCFEMFGFGIAAACLPFYYGSP